MLSGFERYYRYITRLVFFDSCLKIDSLNFEVGNRI